MPDLSARLRRAKRRVALLAALADLGGVWSLDQVTGALTDLADRATHTALTALVADEIRRRKLPGKTEDDAATGAGMVVMAMGKMGARELNYSSDIDLICLFDEDAFAPDDYQEARTSFIRVTRKMCGLLSDLTDEGLCVSNGSAGFALTRLSRPSVCRWMPQSAITKALGGPGSAPPI